MVKTIWNFLQLMHVPVELSDRNSCKYFCLAKSVQAEPNLFTKQDTTNSLHRCVVLNLNERVRLRYGSVVGLLQVKN